MKLQNNLYTEPGWEIAERSFDAEQLVTTGSNFMIGNGYLGYRGTFAEWEADRYVACIVTDTFDTAADSKWRELCNAPNGLYTRLMVGGELLSHFTGETRDYARQLDLRHGCFSRRQSWAGEQGGPITLEVEKFASYDNLHIIAMRYSFEAEAETNVSLVTGIDGRVWSLNGEHFKRYEPLHFDDPEAPFLAIETETVEFGIQIDVVTGIRLDGPAPTDERVIQGERRIMREIDFHLQPGEKVTMEKVAVIYTSNDVDSPRETALADAEAALDAGFDALKAAHAARWDEIWAASDIQIEGKTGREDEALEAQVVTRFNLYQNIIATPTHARLPIGARGLSCQVYQGAAFWDQEIFNLPMFLYTQPEVARNILAYRYETLDGARQKAARLGYYGAYYAWTSGKTGEELFPDYFFTNVLTGRKIRNHFNDWQIHISPDIVYALWLYDVATADWDFVVECGAEIAFEVAQFLVSHAYFKKDKRRYEFIRLLGPDEYHENVDNNAFTNYQAKFALERALIFHERMQARAPAALAALMARLGLDEGDLANWREMVELIYLPAPDPDTLLIEQCDGFFELEDIRPEEARERLIDPEEYWGWPNGVAVHAQVLKQADVVQLLALHKDLFPVEVKRANYDYYEPHTEHGSSLSPSVHALVATWAGAGYEQEAYDYFWEASTIDLYNASKKVMSGGSFLGGIHTAAAGAVWQMIVLGFAGLNVTEDHLAFEPALPEAWEKVAFRLVVRDNVLDVEVDHEHVKVTAAEDNPAAMPVRVAGRAIAPGASQVLIYPPTEEGY